LKTRSKTIIAYKAVIVTTGISFI